MAKVVSIVPYKFLPAKIGGQKGIAVFNQYFGRYVQLVCLTVKDNENQYAEGYEAIPFFSASRMRYLNPFPVFRLAKLVRDRKATHIQIEHPFFGWLLFLLKHLTNAKLIVHSHNMEGERFKTLGKWWWWVLWRYERFTHRLADYNFFIHEADREYAIREFSLDANKCLVVTYGIEQSSIPSPEEIAQAKTVVRKKHAIAIDEKIFLFTGSFNYGPNVEAFEIIDRTIAPLLQQKGFRFKFLICGPWLNIDAAKHPNVLITGFVDDISVYFKAADVFVNPVLEGGGIKTKLVEALGFNTNAVSTLNGATGVNPALCNGKLLLADENKWEAFAECIIKASGVRTDISPEYYQHFYWGYSTKKAAAFIQSNS